MQIVRWYKFSQLTLSIVNHLKPHKDSFTSLNEEIISLSTKSGQAERLSELQIKSSLLHSYVSLSKELETLMQSLTDLDLLRKDKEMSEVVEEEISEKEEELKEVEDRAIDQILDRDVDDSSDIILEIKPGVGGSESSLFSEDVLNMYIAYAESMRWRCKIMHIAHDSQINKGVKEVMVKIEGTSVYSVMKYESGVHKVIRVPATERAGRLHSSTACVIVLPDRPPVRYM